jgi:hypothetical protein
MMSRTTLSGRAGVRVEVAEVFDRVSVIREMISEYAAELDLTRSRLDAHRLRRAKYELAREFLVEHGETDEAKRLDGEIHDMDHQIVSDQRLADKLTGLLETYRRALAIVQGS